MNSIIELCGVAAGIGAGIAAFVKWVVIPIKNITEQLEDIKQIKSGQKQLMKAQAQTMEHLITGNNVEALRKEYNDLIHFVIERE